jgi:DNA polymerase-4
MNTELEKLATLVAGRLERYGLKGRTITLKIKYNDFKQITRSRSYQAPIGDADALSATAKELLLSTELADKKIRLLGISVSNFKEQTTGETGKADIQLKLFV